MLKQQNEYLKALLNNVEQQQLKLLQTIINAQQQYYAILQRNQELAILQQRLQPPAQHQTLYYYPTNVERHYDANSFDGADGNPADAHRINPEYFSDIWPATTAARSQQYYPNSMYANTFACIFPYIFLYLFCSILTPFNSIKIHDPLSLLLFF